LLCKGVRFRRFVNIEALACRTLRQLEVAARVYNLQVPPGNRLAARKGRRAGPCRIRSNDRWRVCFRWTQAGAFAVEIIDGHQGEVIVSNVNAITPGELLLEEFRAPMGISQYRLAKEIAVPAQRSSEIVAGRRAITADTDLRLGRFFGLSSGYWQRAQAAHDSELAERELAPVLKRIRPWATNAGRQHAAAGTATRRRGSVGISQPLTCGAAARSRCQWYVK